MEFAALGECEFTLQPAVLQVKTKRNQRQSFLGRPSYKLADLTAVQQKFSRPKGIVIRIVTMGIRTNVAIEQPDFPAFDKAISILEIDTAISCGFDLGPCQDDSSFELFEDLVIVKGLSVNRDLFAHRTTPGVAPRFPGPVCCGGGVAIMGNPAFGGGGCAPAGVTSGLFPPIGGGTCPGATPPELEDVAAGPGAGAGGTAPKGEFAWFAG